MCEKCILFDIEKKYCMLFDEKTNGEQKHYGCCVRRPMNAEEIIDNIKEAIEEWYKAREEDEEVDAGYMLDSIYDKILYETDVNYYNKRIKNALKIKKEKQ